MSTRFFAFAFLIGSLSLFLGCETMNKTGGTAASSPTDNVIILAGPHGGTATYRYDSATSKATLVSSEGDMKPCPACVNDVNSYYATGKIDAVCKDCGAKRTVAPYTGRHG